MRKLIISFVVTICCYSASAQKLHATLFTGLSNYQGDLQAKRFTFQQANVSVGAGLLYEVSKKLYIRGNVTFGKVKGDDRLSGTYISRNLSFSSPVTDIHLGLEYDVLNSYEYSLVPYVFGGMAVFHYNPSTLDSSKNKVFLQPLGTEGQGFFMGRKKYQLTDFAIAFGGGLKLRLSENIVVRFELGLRKTFTDYLDDVSTTYADENLLFIDNGPKAVELAFRGDEKVNGLTYPPANTVRGNPKSKDWYYFTGFGISFRLSPLFNINSAAKSKTGCPVNIY